MDVVGADDWEDSDSDIFANLSECDESNSLDDNYYTDVPDDKPFGLRREHREYDDGRIVAPIRANPASTDPDTPQGGSNDSKEVHCPCCQAPLNGLLREQHVEACLQEMERPSTECPDGGTCTSKDPNHYRRFSHTKLCKMRSLSCGSIIKLNDDHKSKKCPATKRRKKAETTPMLKASKSLPDSRKRLRLQKRASLPTTPLSAGSVRKRDIGDFFKNTKRVSTSSSESRKRQSDIGVFFGLKPLAQTARIETAATTTKTNPGPNSSKYAATRAPRTCPFYKWVSGTKFTVDAFRYGKVPQCAAYFLSHFHSDHYMGLTPKFEGLIYCSEITARLVILQLRVKASQLRPLSMDTTHVIDGVKVTLIDANHCPGAVLFIFELPNGHVHLHTGDFRANMEMRRPLERYTIDTLYLDTTYLNDKYCFDSQEAVLNRVCTIARDANNKHGDKVLFVAGTYLIGKEKVFLALAEAFHYMIYVDDRKRKIYDTFQNAKLESLLTRSDSAARIHVVSMGHLKFEYLDSLLARYKDRYTACVAFRPTGWSHSQKATCKQKGAVYIHSVPYSEHSSYVEMRDFVKHVQPRRILATVNNGTAKGRSKMTSYFKQWLGRDPS